jgi:hypothetical protein
MRACRSKDHRLACMTDKATPDRRRPQTTRGHRVAELLDDPDQLIGPGAVLAGEAEELARPLDAGRSPFKTT